MYSDNYKTIVKLCKKWLKEKENESNGQHGELANALECVIDCAAQALRK